MYGKIFASIFHGSLRMNWEALVTFQQMIILCDDQGIVDMTADALAAVTGIPLKIIEKGIEILESEDSMSRSQKLNGRRIERIDEHRPWGWQLVNFEYYKRLAKYEDKKRADRERIAKKRESEKLSDSEDVADCREASQKVAHKDKDKDTDKEKTIVETSAKSSTPASCPHEKIKELYNLHCPSLPRLLTLSKQRKQKLQVRWREHSDILWWTALFQKVEETPFCCGQNDRGWKASFDWLIANDTNALKVLEDKYSNERPAKKSDGLVGCKKCTTRAAATTMDLKNGVCWQCRRES